MKVNIHSGGNGVFPFVNWTHGRCYLNLMLRDQMIDYVFECPVKEDAGEFPVEDMERLAELLSVYRAACLVFPGED